MYGRSITIPFNRPFPHKPISVVVNSERTVCGSEGYNYVSNLTTTSFDAIIEQYAYENHLHTDIAACYWFSIGY